MGVILGTRTSGEGKIVFEVELDYEESLKLKGCVRNVHIFSEDALDIETHLSQRGTNEATKYFLIPRSLRDSLDFSKNVKCQEIDTDKKKIFVFAVDKVW